MKILGVEIKHPGPRNLAISALLILCMFIMSMTFYYLGLLDERGVKMLVFGLATGVLANAFGISIKSGMGGIILLILIGTFVYILLLLL